MSEQVLASKLVSAQVVRTQAVRGLRVAMEGAATATRMTGFDLGGRPPMSDGFWAGARAVLTSQHLRLEAGPLTRMVTPQQHEVSIELRRVVDISIDKGLLTDVVCVTAADVQLRMRCYDAPRFADDIRRAVRDARPGLRHPSS